MSKNILVFRTDRIGDLLVTCPSIKTIKEYFPNSKVSIVTSKKIFLTQKLLVFLTKFIYFQKAYFKKIKLFNELSKKRFDIFLFLMEKIDLF